MISRFQTDGTIIWVDGTIKSVRSVSNYSYFESFGPLEGLCAPAHLLLETHEKYLLSEQQRMEEEGIDLSQIELAEYWYLLIARPGDEIGYCISLNAKHYTQDDVIAFAKTVSYLK